MTLPLKPVLLTDTPPLRFWFDKMSRRERMAAFMLTGPFRLQAPFVADMPEPLLNTLQDRELFERINLAVVLLCQIGTAAGTALWGK